MLQLLAQMGSMNLDVLLWYIDVVFWLLALFFSQKSFDDKSALFRAYYSGYLVFQQFPSFMKIQRASCLHQSSKGVTFNFLERFFLSFTTHASLRCEKINKHSAKIRKGRRFSGLTSRVLEICNCFHFCFFLFLGLFVFKMVLHGSHFKCHIQSSKNAWHFLLLLV